MIGTRRLVVDLAATSRNWALPPEGQARLLEAAPVDWEVTVVQAPTVSDGDGGRLASAEALDAMLRQAGVIRVVGSDEYSHVIMPMVIGS